MLLIVTLALVLFQQAMAVEDTQSAIRSETLLRSSSSWDDEPYKSYPRGRPELSVLKITLQPHTKLEWHSHPIPSAAYIVAGELTLEREKDGQRQRLTAGQALSETVDTFHQGSGRKRACCTRRVLRRKSRRACHSVSVPLSLAPTRQIRSSPNEPRVESKQESSRESQVVLLDEINGGSCAY